jgi:hypothetical protein
MSSIKEIQFHPGTDSDCLLGFYLMRGIMEDVETGEIEYIRSFSIGFIFFTMVIYFDV